MLEIFLIIIAVFILLILAYIIYVYAQYHRIPDNQPLEIENQEKSSEPVEVGKVYNIMTYNIGYASYPAEYDFFMDGGSNSRAFSRAAVLGALKEDLDLIKEANPDFIGLQEVDWEGDRSWQVDQPTYFKQELPDYASSLAQNYDSAYLFYPIKKPIGKAKSGLLTLSKYRLESATRFQLPIEQNFAKFFDLDRAFSVNIFPVKASDKKLVIINTHLSAFIKNQVIQREQLLTLFSMLEKYQKAGDYVICGGDFNHVLAGEAHPELTWLKPFPLADLPEGLRALAPTNGPTVRSNGTPYDKENPKNTFGIIDGFILSDNIKEKEIRTISNDFKSSDHHPVLMSFELL
ncbi:endonuclease/exonuclease/phosphatase family protein [Lactococcus termiticola]|uniref:Metal-dependent hydrolase n=1 Tax=Lactococcus termiticola TaxID=2169526 RepID=A0A2R5HFE9_9LACT|nr:endonuclease/exonuclease/phosphatase family protein [Lactococcus termiticola]GBG96764.1 metal-dependent hydrolase [Lactococcus termiticola]